MADSSIGAGAQGALRSLALALNTFLHHVHGFEGLRDAPAGFSTAKFRATVGELAKAIDKEVTYMIVACKPPAREEDVEGLCPKINAGFFRLVQEVNRIPSAAGHEYLAAVRSAVCRSLAAAVSLLNSFIADKVEIEKALMAELNYMSIAGVFWEHCKTLSQIPADNRAAAAAAWSVSVGNLVNDAADELHESLDSAGADDADDDDDDDDSGEDSMDEFDGEIPAARVKEGRQIEKLVLAAKRICDRVGQRCIRDCKQLDDERTVWLDRLVELGKAVQAAVDDLIATLFMDDEDEWSRHAGIESEKLRRALVELITLAVTFVDDAHLAWFEQSRAELSASRDAGPAVVR
ncbi:hypothetical protein H4R18_002362 [Coemansia javaensis]|uniref:Cyclin-D1-binding protein 1-like N-terminal domain-containing protein n=1 Tax=Coemansia javaensis TaxID=2761396 RepID=A0A9W8HCB8_9FUNG|nr:hypothetical protein H4R18_002362 [Coemansia javaensis]